MSMARVLLLILIVAGFMSNLSIFSTESEDLKFNWVLVSICCYFVCFLILMLVKTI